MSFAYIKNIVNEDWCLGNSLSTINIAFTSLDLALSALSAYTVQSVGFLSSTMISVSSNLQTQINYISANVTLNYIKQGTIFQLPNGIINWNLSANGRNVRVVLSANGFLSNPQGSIAGEEGKLVIQSNGISGYTLTGYGTTWMFSGGLSSMTASISAYNQITFLNDQSTKSLATMYKF